MSATYFESLSGIRGLAAAVVFISHLVQIHFLRFTGLGTPLHQLSSLASEYAVMVFFVLSGYLITHSLEENISRNGRLRLDIFLTARMARIYPPLLFSIVLSATVFFVIKMYGLPGSGAPLSIPGDLYAAREVIHLSILEIVGAIVMLQGMLEINGPLWSIYIEAKLYVLFAIILSLFTGRKSPILVGAFFLIAWSGIKFNPGFANYAAVWLTGSLAYYIWTERQERLNRIILCGTLIGVILVMQIVQSFLRGGGGGGM